MTIPRRFLPSLSLLTAFEAAARTGSVTTAARDLNLTQSAVSRQIQALEKQIGVDLFIRERQTIRLTAAGESYAREISEVLRRISTASMNIRANPQGGTLNLAILPTFGAHWLVPRLGGFLAEHPDIQVNCVSRYTTFDFRLDSVDAALHYGPSYWPGADLTFLMSESIQPVCSRAFLQAHTLACVEDFLDVPLLHLTSRPDAWERWLAHHQVHDVAVHGMLFDQFYTLAQAARAGLGVALLPTWFVPEACRAGDLVLAHSELVASDGAYYLASPPERQAYPPLQAFRRWVLSQGDPA